jgi:hypothetical protein
MISPPKITYYLDVVRSIRVDTNTARIRSTGNMIAAASRFVLLNLKNLAFA